ncbi:MAG: hypothetical protein AAGG68_03310 [Bacteroidota bacterium]
MKKITLSIFLLATFLFTQAQDQLNNHLAEAKTNYASDNLEDARFALQQSLNELYIVISKQILETLPETLGDTKAQSEGDQYNGTAMGYTGVFIDRTYASADQKKVIDVSLVHDSPLMSSIGSFLASPLMNLASGRKSLKIDGYKSALETSESDAKTYTIYIPFAQSLITLTFNGYDSETEVIGLANQLPIKEIVEVAQ